MTQGNMHDRADRKSAIMHVARLVEEARLKAEEEEQARLRAD